MGLPPWETSDGQFFVLITGANSGLGFAIASRLIDEFITSPATPPNKHLILILSTRAPIKTRFTISRLRAHLRKLADYSPYAKSLRRKAAAQGNVYKWEDMVQRVHFLGVEVDLCNLKSVYELADKLVNGTIGSPDATTMDGLKLPHGSPGTQSFSKDIKQDDWALSQKEGSIGAQRSWGWGLSGIKVPRIDAVFLNASIGGWKGLNWPQAFWDVAFDTVEALSRPKYKVPDVGRVTDAQLGSSTSKSSAELTQSSVSSPEEPPLGAVFCSNIFGHYILTHELMPLLSRPASTSAPGGKVIWISSLEAVEEAFTIDDFQAIKSYTAYESSKRLTDLLVLTSDLPSVQHISAPFFDSSNTITISKSKTDSDSVGIPLVKPKIYVTHPGNFVSDLMPIPSFMMWGYVLVFWLMRFFGSPWHHIDPYNSAVSSVWVALTDDEVLDNMQGTRCVVVKMSQAQVPHVPLSIAIGPDSGLTIRLVEEEYATGPVGDVFINTKALATMKVSWKLLENSSGKFKAQLADHFKESTEIAVGLYEGIVKSLELWFRVLHRNMMDDVYDISIKDVWEAIEVAGYQDFQTQKLNEWFGKCLER
ncbi:hypothetical protein B7494_g3642 [Chlorociboria aeruginascens]|nr:hypothetical protein B7494_g3642 [Chlorociboria aeruginascens]